LDQVVILQPHVLLERKKVLLILCHERLFFSAVNYVRYMIFMLWYHCMTTVVVVHGRTFLPIEWVITVQRSQGPPFPGNHLLPMFH